MKYLNETLKDIMITVFVWVVCLTIGMVIVRGLAAELDRATGGIFCSIDGCK